MPSPELQIEGVNVVLLGAFNPQIFHPSWYAAEGLVRKQEAETAEIEVIHSQIASFSMGAVQLRVRPDIFIASTADPSAYEPLRDLVLGTFQLLRHTPINKVGINRHLHFQMASEEAWHELGDWLAPKPPWANVLDQPGLLRLEMQGSRPDDFAGYMRIRVEPSNRVRPGVFMQINDHYELSDEETSNGCSAIMNLLDRVWKTSVERSATMAYALLEDK